IFWSLAAGVVTTVGALGIILAFKFRGSPIYVMPLVFGCAPVVNTFVTMAMARTFKEAGPIFFAGVLIVALGAAGVMWFKPSAKNVIVEEHDDGRVTVIYKDIAKSHEEKWGPITLEQLQSSQYAKALPLYQRYRKLSMGEMLMVAFGIGLTALCWGSYGPLLHKGQMKMAGSRMRPFLCVGLAY